MTARHGEVCRSQSESLEALDRLIDGRVAIGSAEAQVTLQDMLWSFSRAITHPCDLNFEISQQILERVLWPKSVPLSADRFADHYLVARLVFHIDHKDGIAQVWHDIQHTIPKPKRSIEGSKEKLDHHGSTFDCSSTKGLG
jgi:hypothetical protein